MIAGIWLVQDGKAFWTSKKKEKEIKKNTTCWSFLLMRWSSWFLEHGQPANAQLQTRYHVSKHYQLSNRSV